MPTKPKGQRHSADVIGNAIRVAQIAAGEVEEELPHCQKKGHAAVPLGSGATSATGGIAAPHRPARRPRIFGEAVRAEANAATSTSDGRCSRLGGAHRARPSCRRGAVSARP